MALFDTILNAGGGAALNQIAQHLGISQEQAQSAMGSILPALMQGAQQNGGGALQGLLGALQSGDHQKYVDDPSQAVTPEAIENGHGVLDQLLGGQGQKDAVAQQVSSETGVGADVIHKMMPMVASLAMGALSKESSQPGGGGLMGLIGKLF